MKAKKEQYYIWNEENKNGNTNNVFPHTVNVSIYRMRMTKYIEMDTLIHRMQSYCTFYSGKIDKNYG